MAMARSGLPASASSTSVCSSAEPNVFHHCAVTGAAAGVARSLYAAAGSTLGWSMGEVVAHAESIATVTR